MVDAVGGERAPPGRIDVQDHAFDAAILARGADGGDHALARRDAVRIAARVDDGAVHPDDTEHVRPAHGAEARRATRSEVTVTVDDLSLSVDADLAWDFVVVGRVVGELRAYPRVRPVRRPIHDASGFLGGQAPPLDEPLHELLVEQTDDRLELLLLRLAHRALGELLASALVAAVGQDVRNDASPIERRTKVRGADDEPERSERGPRADEDAARGGRDVDLLGVAATRQVDDDLLAGRAHAHEERTEAGGRRHPARERFETDEETADPGVRDDLVRDLRERVERSRPLLTPEEVSPRAPGQEIHDAAVDRHADERALRGRAPPLPHVDPEEGDLEGAREEAEEHEA